jgi:hypothetical protein
MATHYCSGPAQRWPSSFPRRFAHLHQPLGVFRGGGLLVVVEVAVDRQAFASPLGDRVRPAVQRPLRIAAFVPARGPVAAEVDVVGGDFPWRRGVVVVGEAECGVVVAEQVENRRVVPAWMAELEDVGPLLVQQLEE